jgi:DNA-binding GntR family transcriptional regulator
VAKSTLSDSVYEQLKSEITRWVYRPGERLPEVALTERYGVSRTPIREALRKLERERLVVYVPRQGYTARNLNLRELDELYQVRIALEELSAGVAAKTAASGEAASILGELHSIWEERARETPPPDNPELVHADEAFHETIALAGGNAYLHRSLQSINENIRIIRIIDFRSAHRIDATYREHARIINHIIEGRAAQARQEMRDHIRVSQENVRANAMQALYELHS